MFPNFLFIWANTNKMYIFIKKSSLCDVFADVLVEFESENWWTFFLLFLLGGGGVWSSEYNNYLVTAPQNPFLEIGTNFTATCMITNTAEVTVDDLYWNLSKTTVSKEYYIKINRTALNVTVPIINEEPGWLHCLCNKKSPDVVLNKSKFMGAIWLRKGCKFCCNQKHDLL